MSGDLRAGSGAGRRQRILVTPQLRATCASVLSLVALLAWMAVSPSVRSGHDAGEPTAVASAVSSPFGAAFTAVRPLTKQAAQSAHAGVRHQLLVRARATEGDGETTSTSLLASSLRALAGDVAEPARVRLRLLARSHSPYDELSPFDATAPPSSSRRNG
jgi:hypothetical protein